MNSVDDLSAQKVEGRTAIVELYKTAFARLNFQDEYLFKFSTVFLTAHGALAVLAGSAFFRASSSNYPALLVIGLVGLLLAIVWCLWTRHNDYWHAVWIGALRTIEQDHFDTDALVFAAKHAELAKRGGRTDRFLPSGHAIAQLIPVILLVAWAFTVWVAW